MSKAAWIFSIIMVLTGCVTGTPIIESVDRVSGVTTTSLRMGWAWFGPEEVILYFRCEKGADEERYIIRAECTKKTWWAIDTLYFLVDGERFRLEPVSVEKHRIIDLFTEIAVFESSRDFFQTLASASTVNFQIGGVGGKAEWGFGEEHFRDLQSFLDRVQSGS